LRKAHTASDGIIGHKLVFVASNKLANCDKKKNSITSLKPDVAASNSTGRETLERPTRLVQVVIVCDIQPVLHPTTKSFEPSLEGLCCFMYLHVGFERLSLNSDSRQRSPRQMTTDLPSERCKRVRCTVQEWIDLSRLLSKIPTSPAALLYMAVLAQHDYLH
jgi:hypothetical protein